MKDDQDKRQHLRDKFWRKLKHFYPEVLGERDSEYHLNNICFSYITNIEDYLISNEIYCDNFYISNPYYEEAITFPMIFFYIRSNIDMIRLELL